MLLNLLPIRFAVLTATLLTAGCTTPTLLSEARTVKPLFVPALNGSPQNAKLVVVRDSGMSGALLEVTVFLDGRMIGVLKPGDMLEFYVVPDNYVLGVGCAPCNEDYRKELQVTASANRSHFFRTMFLNGLEIQATTQVK